MTDLSQSLAVFFWYVVLVLVPGGLFSILLHYLLSLPMQRRDRALFFLDLLETILKRGQPVEPAFIAAATYRDRSAGVHFFLVAAHMENGSRLGQALAETPGYLPPQVNAILQTGERLGDLRKVLPACREVLRLAPDTVRTTMHYMIAILLVFAPTAIGMIFFIITFVVPKFKEVMAGMGTQPWILTRIVFGLTPELILLEILLFLSLALAALVYIGGPRFVHWFQFRSIPVVDWISWCLPWKHKKLLRTFSAMLAVLLDGGVPEAEAVRLAGDCTANEICRRRAQRVVNALAEGMTLNEAIRFFDATGEFRWRLSNATHARGGFLQALRGWHEALDAKAFQQEETTAHAVTSGLVIVNGTVVALLATAIFGMLIVILKRMLETT